MSNLVVALLDELERVVAKRERWRICGREVTQRERHGLAAGIGQMTSAILAAKAAIATDDAVASLLAFRQLQWFSHDD